MRTRTVSKFNVAAPPEQDRFARPHVSRRVWGWGGARNAGGMVQNENGVTVAAPPEQDGFARPGVPVVGEELSERRHLRRLEPLRGHGEDRRYLRVRRLGYTGGKVAAKTMRMNKTMGWPTHVLTR